jgi:hypothetical protein
LHAPLVANAIRDVISPSPFQNRAGTECTSLQARQRHHAFTCVVSSCVLALCADDCCNCRSRAAARWGARLCLIPLCARRRTRSYRRPVARSPKLAIPPVPGHDHATHAVRLRSTAIAARILSMSMRFLAISLMRLDGTRLLSGHNIPLVSRSHWTRHSGALRRSLCFAALASLLCNTLFPST